MAKQQTFRSPRDSQPPKHQEANGKQARAIALADAELAVMWLNAAREAKAPESYEVVVSIRRELEDLRVLTNMFKEAAAAIDWQRVHDARGKEKALLEAEMKAYAAEYGRLRGEVERRFNALNKVLIKYVFRPGVTYLAMDHVWYSGMMSDVKGFQLKVGERLISEGDAVMALVRLAASREIQTVHLCAQCQRRWHVARRSIDKFCSSPCRFTFHTDSDEYRAEKAASQREYRKRLKRYEENHNKINRKG